MIIYENTTDTIGTTTCSINTSFLDQSGLNQRTIGGEADKYFYLIFISFRF
jgi:hypothetical protein